MKKDKYKNLIFAYTVLYTFVTVLNSILYLYNGIYEDPSGNWHEIDRAIIVLIGVVAYALVTELIIKPMVLRYVVSYIPTVLLAFFYVWSTSFRENLAQSAYMDVWINFTSMFVRFCIVHFIVYKCRKKKETMK